jgi:hypothetical protein
MDAERRTTEKAALRDTRPAIGLFVLGALCFFPSVWVEGGHPMFGILTGFALMPFAAMAIVLLLPTPRGLTARFALALLVGVTLVGAMVGVVAVSH